MKKNKLKEIKENEVILHGECMLFASKIPKGAKKVTAKGFMIVANSETTGNHHVVNVMEGVQFYRDEKDVLFMENEVETHIQCVQGERHDAIAIPPGTYEFGSQQEYDPFLARMQAVKD